MASNAKRPRKACPKCNAVFSDRHARRHLLECNVRFCDIGTATNTEPKCYEFSNDNDISDEEPEFNFDLMKKWKNMSSTSCNNLEDEDIEAYFDASSDIDDFSELSDSYSYIDYENGESVNKESNIDSEIAQKTHWFCKLLLLWQCTY